MHDELTTLAYTVEAAVEPSAELDAVIWLHLPEQEAHAWKHGCNKYSHARQIAGLRNIPRYTSSLDAAMTLVPDGWCKTVADYWCEGEDKPPFFADCGDLPALKRGEDMTVVDAYAATPALALTVAALRARASRLRMEVE